jgi:hypothetical protein
VPRSEYLRVCEAWDQERLLFEQKSEKVMRILERKDGIIHDLKQELASAQAASGAGAGAGARGEFERQLRNPAGVAGRSANNSSTTAGSSHLDDHQVASMQEKILDQSEQIEVLLIAHAAELSYAVLSITS